MMTIHKMCIRLPFFILALALLLTAFFQTELSCIIDCEQLKYTKPCRIACKQEHSIENMNFRLIEYYPIPSNLWYGLTKKYRNASDENNGIYLSLNNDHLVKYMKVYPSYIKNSPWKTYYSLNFKDNIKDNINNYTWYLPAITPLYMLPTYQNFVDIISINVIENGPGISHPEVQSRSEHGVSVVSVVSVVNLKGDDNYYFFITADPGGVGIKFFGKKN